MHIYLKSIASILKLNFLEMPPFQRSYAWSNDVPQLMEDIADNLGQEKYFIGTVCTSTKEGSSNLQIIDGQQRFATISIMLAAARDCFSNMEDSDNICSHLDSFLFGVDMENDSTEPKLRMSKQDAPFFSTRFIDRASCAPKHESHRRLEEAYKIVHDTFSQMERDELRAWINFIQNKLEVIHVESERADEVYALFETINDRGVQLAQADLIKNHLFRTSGNAHVEDIQDAWATVVDKMEEAGNEGFVILFFRHYWSSIHGLTRERNRALLRAIQNRVKTANAALLLARDLVSNAELYSGIVRPEKLFWDDYSRNGEAYGHVETLESFRLDRYRPLLLSAMRKWGMSHKKDMDGLLHFLVAWLARPLIIGDLSSGTLEKAYCKHAKEIHQGDTKDFAQLRRKIQDEGLVMSDKKFEDELKIASISKAWLARYFLATLETYMRNKSHPELIVNRDPHEVNLEHIMPKKAMNPAWNAFTQEQKTDYLNRIGNLTLLSAPLNNSVKNGPYMGKVDAYRQSELRITNKIPDEYNEWNVSSLEQRQEKLAALAVKAWRYGKT